MAAKKSTVSDAAAPEAAENPYKGKNPFDPETENWKWRSWEYLKSTTTKTPMTHVE